MAESVNMLINGIKEAVVNNSLDMFYALFILIAGYIIAVILAYVARKTLQKLKVDDYIREKGKIPLKVSSVVGTAIKWYLILIVLHVAISQLGRLDAVALQLQNFISFVPAIIEAAVVIFISYVLGIYVKEDINPNSNWHYLGTSPIEGIRLPITFFRWKVEKEGYNTIQGVLFINPKPEKPDDPIFIKLDLIGVFPAKMVRIPGTDDVGDFYIDAFEVTNRELALSIAGVIISFSSDPNRPDSLA